MTISTPLKGPPSVPAGTPETPDCGSGADRIRGDKCDDTLKDQSGSITGQSSGVDFVDGSLVANSSYVLDGDDLDVICSAYITSRERR